MLTHYTKVSSRNVRWSICVLVTARSSESWPDASNARIVTSAGSQSPSPFEEPCRGPNLVQSLMNLAAQAAPSLKNVWRSSAIARLI
jgi:hypothetical protein